MADTENTNTMVQSRLLLGRRQIFTDEKEITAANVAAVLREAAPAHFANRDEIEYLYKVYRGAQAVLGRTKSNHEDICAKITENVCAEIKDFWSGYLCGEPIQYVSANGENSEAINKLNTVCAAVSKATVDKEIVDWMMICGVGYRIITAKPFEMYALDPRNAFVIYENSYSKKPLAGVVYDRIHGENIYYVYTQNKYFVVEGEAVTAVKDNGLGIAIIEYPANTQRQGCFERAIPLTDAINELQSNRLDGVAQQIQSLLVLYNAALPDGTTADEVRKLGLIQLVSNEGAKGDIKEIATILDQTAMQTFKKDLYEAALRICGVPAVGNANTSDSSNNGAVILKNGWQGAEARAKDFELMFKRSERDALAIMNRTLSVNGVVEFDPAEIDPHFTRRQYEDVYSKSQVLVNMLNSNKIAPRLAFATSGLFTDPEAAYKESTEWEAAHPVVQVVNTEETETETEDEQTPSTD